MPFALIMPERGDYFGGPFFTAEIALYFPVAVFGTGGRFSFAGNGFPAVRFGVYGCFPRFPVRRVMGTVSRFFALIGASCRQRCIPFAPFVRVKKVVFFARLQFFPQRFNIVFKGAAGKQCCKKQLYQKPSRRITHFSTHLFLLFFPKP
jgi:hypothetical protein